MVNQRVFKKKRERINMYVFFNKIKPLKVFYNMIIRHSIVVRSACCTQDVVLIRLLIFTLASKVSEKSSDHLMPDLILYTEA